jgi:hypothetical protein
LAASSAEKCAFHAVSPSPPGHCRRLCRIDSCWCWCCGRRTIDVIAVAIVVAETLLLLVVLLLLAVAHCCDEGGSGGR